MTINRSKVAIIGTGLVGSSTAFSLVTQGACDEVLLIDLNKERARGEMMDLRHGIDYLNRNVKVNVGDYSDCADADIVVITAGAPPREGQTRLDTLGASKKIIESIVSPIMESGFTGIFLIISNPVDIIAQYVYKLSGLPKSQVIGTGTALDTARLKNLIGDLVQIDPRSVHAYALGEHGDSQMVPWSRVTVGGKTFTEILRDNPERFKGVDLDQLVHDTIGAGWEILKRKGTTYYGIATTAAGIIKAVLQDENRIIPVSTLLDGEYGERGVFCGVPAILGRTGVKEIVELHLTDTELEKFHRSAELIRGFARNL
ncbi:MAG: L-lactate dehydrogenase [Ruminococcaceae bacterium]|nr:L-lactate dehydrogenase [Oscillospiraceae bacterium]